MSPAPAAPAPPSRLDELLGIDVRSLAVFRIGVGALLLYDLATRAVDLRAHYTDWGVLPRDAAAAWLGERARLSLHLLGGSTWFEALLFALAGACAAALALGWRTRVATVASFVLLQSLQARNPLVDHGGDNVLRVMLFWSMFLPLGAAWSFDAARRRARGESALGRHVRSMAAIAIRLQLCYVYWFTALLKTAPSWHAERSAIARALHLDHLVTPFGQLLLDYPRLLEVATVLTLWLELLGPLLVWVPVLLGPTRFVAVLVFVQFHLVGLGAALELGTFPWVCAVSWLLFLPTWFWDRLPATRKAAHVAEGAARLEPPPSSPRAETGASASRFGRRALDVVAAVLLAYVTLWNVESLGGPFRRALPSAARTPGWVLGLHQGWRMFTPGPPHEDGWYVMPGLLESGRELDAWTGELATYAKPRLVSEVMRNPRWRKLLANLWDPDYEGARPLFTAYLCRAWNEQHEGPEHLLGFQLVYVSESWSPEHGESEPQRNLLVIQPCPPAVGGAVRGTEHRDG
jgi:hypothetical protein